MAIQRFTLVGDHSSPEDFLKYLFQQLSNSQLLEVQALENQDDIARRRSPSMPQPFIFSVDQMLTDRGDGHRFFFVYDEDENFIRVDAYHDEVAFSLIT